MLNNAIVLIDRIQIEVGENGLALRGADTKAAQQMFWPIKLTTTVGGLLSLWRGCDSLFVSEAVAIQIGVVFGSILTL